ncbi:hypothetical protein FOC1_g10005027 [Fusarium oxysporum f. sp. cubense race 1]|uniref:Uncharacterized protein n=1 Tax=Fusarium oxysporum f. sp. cubense (strain race 1) TaxID=1229664 RepID=N4U4B6_FUSC1|nr:hypothetical protein FOC1_g10005027 [Fusarium oxysporum f. sp. cubense race 1]
MAIQHPAARDDQFQAHAIGHRLRRDVTPEECYQCESAYQYVRQMQRNEKLCADDAFYDLYSSCVGCIEDNVNSGSPRDVANPLTTTEVAQPEDSASSSNIPKKNGSSPSKAWIAGAVVPFVLFVITAVSFAIWWQRRRNRTPKTTKSPHVDDVAGTSRFDKPELDSQGIPRPRSKEEAITSTCTTALDTVALPVPAEMPENGLNRAEFQGEAKGGTGENHGSGAYYELPANEATVYELPTKL